MILTNDEEIGKKINSAVFPGLQGGPLMHVIAAKAVAFGEALQPEFKAYAQAVVENAQGAGRHAGAGRPRHRLRRHRHPSDAGRSAAEEADRQGRRAQRSERAGITCNKNGIPFDPEKPTVTSGIRLGSPAAPRAASARGVPRGRRSDRATCSTGSRPHGPSGNGAVEDAVRERSARAVPALPDLRGLKTRRSGDRECAVRSAE